MNTYVKAHWSTSGAGEKIWIPRHRMKTNEMVHKHHIERLGEEIRGLEKLKHGKRMKA